MKKLIFIIFVLFMTGCTIKDNQVNEDISIPKENEEEKIKIDNDSEISKEENTSESIDKTEDNTSSTYQLNKIGNLEYYLYTPKNPTSNMPLIMYLHGGTNKREDVTSLLTTDGFPKYLYAGYYGDLRSYVVIPKLEDGYTGWVDIYIELRDLIKSMNDKYQIDLNRVSLTGHSMGGTGTYQVEVKLPNTFACIAPMSGSIKNTEENINALSKTKVWAFVGTDDTIVSPVSSREIVASLKLKGADAKITELEGATHFDVPSLGYKNMEFINFLVDCSK